MKKTLIALASLAMVAGLASCQKPANDTPVTGNVTLTFGMADASKDTKVAYNETDEGKLRPTWEVGDVVVGQTRDGSTSFSLTVTAVSGSSATVTGNAPKDAEVCLLYKKGLSSIGSQPVTVSYDNQSGDKTMPAVLLSSGEIKDGKGNFKFSGAGAVIGIDNAKGASVGTSITGVTVNGENLSEGEVKNEGGVFTLTAKTKQWDIISTGTLSGITVTDNDGKLSRPIFIAVPVGGKVAKVTLCANGGDSYYTYKLSSEKEVSANSYLYVKEQQTFAKAPDGALPGKFSVSTIKKVYFSKGNLYCDGTNWEFEAEQYYFRTYSGKGKCDAEGYNIDFGTINGHWGLFGWSTTASTNNYGMSTSASTNDYSGSFVDWGNAYCSSKGIAERTWTSLTGGPNGEWKYLFDNHIHVWGTCNNVPGRFIAPDDFKGDAAALSEAIKNWESAQKSGIVFLPAVGSRNGSNVNHVGVRGYYWSSSAYDGWRAYSVRSVSDGAYPSDADSRIYGCGVRLVAEVK